MLSGFTYCYSGATIEQDEKLYDHVQRIAALLKKGDVLLHKMEEQVEKMFETTNK